MTEKENKIESELGLIPEGGIENYICISKELLLEMIKANPKLKAFAWQEIQKYITME